MDRFRRCLARLTECGDRRHALNLPRLYRERHRKSLRRAQGQDHVPAVLSRGGLTAALKTLARRSAVPVVIEIRAETRLPEPVEVAAFYIVSEALTNTA